MLRPEWSVEKIFAAYKALETYHGQSNAPRGNKGPVSIVQTPITPTNMNIKLTNALAAITGYPPILDYNDPTTPFGPFSQWQLTQHIDSTRESSSTAFLNQTVMQPNGNGVNGRKLKIEFGCTVNKIVWENNGVPKARGVTYIQNGVSFTVCAKNELFYVLEFVLLKS